MGFVLKKIIGYWLMPLPFAFGLITAGLLLLVFRRAPRTRNALLLTGVFWLMACSNSWVSRQLIRPLESEYSPVPELAAGAPVPAPLAGCRFVAVLGSGHTDAPGFSANNQLSSNALARITEAVRLLRVLPDARLIVSGPGDPGRPTHADILAQTAEMLGVSPGRIVRIDQARDTEEESLELHRFAGDAPVALVTSAWHMSRAIALCRHAGVKAVPCPTDFAAAPGPENQLADYLGWQAESLQRSTWAIRERLGLLWISLRGKS